MWDIKLKATSKQTRKTNKHSQTHNSTVVSRGKGSGSKGEGGQTRGDRRWFDFGWWAHSAIYRSCIIELYTWNLYNLINQCFPNKFNRTKRYLKKKIVPGWVAQLARVLSHTPKGCWLNLQSGHIPRLWVQPPVGVCTIGNQSVFLSHIAVSLSHRCPSLSVSLSLKNQ